MKQKIFTTKRFSLLKKSIQKILQIKFVLCLLLITSTAAFAQTETLSTGSYIINMGIVPQTQSNALKPYGLIYDLLKNNNVPIKWVISQSKVKDGADFTYLTVQYKGGTFIIPAEYRNAAVNAKITSSGVSGITTTSPLTVDVTFTLTTAPRWVIDNSNNNHTIAEDFFVNAGLPTSAWTSKTPVQLTDCDDIYVMPHATATWATYGPLLDWVTTKKGSFWGGCQTASNIENCFNPGNTAQQLNFLSNNVGAAGNALVPVNDHNHGTPPFTYQFPGSVASQFMGGTEDAQQNGSERIYLPKSGGSWLATTEVISFDPSQEDVPGLSPGPAASIVYGRAFGNSNFGFAMYEGGHDIDAGSGDDKFAAQRAFWNFSFRAALIKVPINATISLANIQVSGNTYTASVSVTSTALPLTFLWSSSCGGTFSSTSTQTTSYTPPLVTAFTYCTITCKVTDACGRSAFSTKVIQIFPPKTNPDFNSTFENQPVPGNVNTNDFVPAGSTYGTSPTLVSSPAGSTASITMNSNGTYSFVSNKAGVYIYDVPVCVPGQVAPCPKTRLTITVFGPCHDNAPVANVDIANTLVNVAVTLKTLANDAVGAPTFALVPSGVTVTVAPLHGSTTVNAGGDITYTPALNYVGFDTLTYQVCDNQSPAKCATAKQIITITASGSPNPNLTTAADDYKITEKDVAATGNVKTNDNDPEGNTQTVAVQNTNVAGKGTLVLDAAGNYTFTPFAGYIGPVDFPYSTCDDGTPQACAAATLHILVRPAPLVTISGHVWNDANGLTDLQINQTGAQAIPNSLNIYLVDINTNLIVQAESILPNGSYSFVDVEINKSYKIVLSTVVAFPGQSSPIPFLPSGWQRVGENLGAGPLSGNDGVPNGLLFIDVEGCNVIDANFGIRLSTGEIITG